MCEGGLSCEPGEVVVDALRITGIDDVDEDTGFVPFDLASADDPLLDGNRRAHLPVRDHDLLERRPRLRKAATLAASADEILVARKGRFVVIGYDFCASDAALQQLLINACLL